MKARRQDSRGFTRTFVVLFLLIVAVAVAAIVVLNRPPVARFDLPPDKAVSEFVGTRAPGPDTAPFSGSLPEAAPRPQRPQMAVAVDTPPAAKPAAKRSPRSGLTTMAELLRKLADIRGKGYNAETEEELTALGRELARENFDNAMRLMKAVSDSGGRIALCRGIFEYQASVNPQQAMSEAMKLDPGSEIAGRFLANFSRDKRVFNAALLAAMKGWAKTSAYDAAMYLARLPESKRASAAVVVYGVWGETDPEAALRQAETLSPDTQIRVVPQICRSWAEKDPAATWRFVVDRGEGLIDNRDALLADIAARWAVDDLDLALAWIDSSVQDDKLYTEIMQNATRKLAGSHPETAATLLGLIPGLYELQPHLLSASMHTWVRKDPEAAAQWAASVELDSVRAMAIKTVSAFWTEKDFDKAFIWATSLSDRMSRAYALSNVALQQGKSDPDKSTGWIYRIGDEFEQARTVAGYVLGRVSRSKDGAAARELRNLIMSDTIDFNAIQETLLTSQLSDEEKRELLALLP